MCDDRPETIEAINACENAGVKLMTALQRRFDPNFERVKQAIVSNEARLPAIACGSGSSQNSGSRPTGGGSLILGALRAQPL